MVRREQVPQIAPTHAYNFNQGQEYKFMSKDLNFLTKTCSLWIKRKKIYFLLSDLYFYNFSMLEFRKLLFLNYLTSKTLNLNVVKSFSIKMKVDITMFCFLVI